ncbi:MAG: DNA mismatch endonuclease Vsr [Bacteroidetes bacterium]|nr:MAG: DNA mismatch endonuclease Vsr [Bacteroidota bacterium]
MADVHTPEQRSYNMSRVRSKDTKPELLVRKFLFSHGFRYKLHDKKLPGKPDIVLPKYKTVIFINGCFWHGHKGCKRSVLPKTRTEWWLAKIARNKELDKINSIQLQKIGWRIFTIFECELNQTVQENTLETLLSNVKASHDD